MLKNIIWDFDEAILPFDQEDRLCKDVINNCKNFRKLYRKFLFKIYSLMIEYRIDYRYTKRIVIALLRGVPEEFIKQRLKGYASKIPKKYIEIIKNAKSKGYKNYIISCGNNQIIEDILSNTGIKECFDKIVSNTLIFKNGILTGCNYEVDNPKKKFEFMNRLGINGEDSIVIGDGIYDIPMMEKAKMPILIGRKKDMIEIGKKRGWIIVNDFAEVEKYI